MSSCFKTEIVQYETSNQDPFTFNTGQQLNSLQRSYTDFCVVSKTCNFYLNMMGQSGQTLKIITVTFQI